MSGVLLDTSVLIAPEPDEGPRPVSAAISVISLGELVAGVELARSEHRRTDRQARLDRVRATFAPIPVDDVVAERYGAILALARRERRTTHASDLLIVATAAAHDRTLITRDERQGALAQAAGVSARVVV